MRQGILRLTAVTVAVCSVLTVGCSDDSPGKKSGSSTTTTVKPVLSKDLTFERILSSDAQFAGIAGLLQAGDFYSTLDGGDEYTLLAPNSEAITALGEETVAALGDGPSPELTKLLELHVLKGKTSYSDLVALGGSDLETLGGTKVPVTFTDGQLAIGGVNVVKSDIATKGGVIHVLDGVISG